METIQASNPVFFKEAKPLSVRIWHWLFFLFFLCSLSTVIFGSTLFRTRDNVTLVQQVVIEKGGIVSKDQARAVAHEFSDKLWMLHKWLGYGLSFLIFSRLIIELTLSKEKRTRERIRTTLNFSNQLTGRNHYLYVNYGYVVFYTLFTVMACTGLVMAFEDVKWLDPVHDLAKQIHSLVQWGLYAYAISHIVGVVLADATKYGGIISDMIGGKGVS